MGDILASFHAPDAARTATVTGSVWSSPASVPPARERATRKNTRMAYLQLEDDSGSMEVIVFSPALVPAATCSRRRRPRCSFRAHLDARRI